MTMSHKLNDLTIESLKYRVTSGHSMQAEKMGIIGIQYISEGASQSQPVHNAIQSSHMQSEHLQQK